VNPIPHSRLTALASAALLGLAGAALAQAAATALPPPNPDPHNFEGTWVKPMTDATALFHAPLKPEYQKVQDEHVHASEQGNPVQDLSVKCFPMGLPRITENPLPLEIVQTPSQLTLLYVVSHNVRRIYLNRPHPQNPGYTFLGHSVGHWEGDTLVVDTVGLYGGSFMDMTGTPHSNQIHVVERYRKLEGGAKLQLAVTVEDPVALEHPFSYTRTYHWRPDVRREEFICEENNRDAPKAQAK
jgi:hypothetical protein